MLFPELALTGYPPEDLVFRESFRSASVRARDELARALAEAGLGELAVIVGYVDSAGGPRNACAVLYRGEVAATYFKHHLPNYGVFDEARYFVPGDRFVVARIRGVDVALTICEDLWQDGGPFAVAARAEVGLISCINGSPYERNKDDVRLPLAARRAAEAGATIAYVNMVGAQDELVYDGDSLIVTPAGEVLSRAEQYRELLVVRDVERARRPRHGDRPGARHDGRAARRLGRAGPGPAGGAGGRRAGRAAGRRGGGLAGAGHRHPGLRPQERLPLGHPRPVRRHRLRGDRGDRRRRARAGRGARGLDALVVLVRALQGATRPTWPGGSASTSAPCRSRRWSRPTCPR